MVDYLRTLLAPYLPQDDERGASAVEYGLLIAGIAAMIVVVVLAFGPQLKELFGDTCDKIASANTAGQTCAR